MSHLNFGSVWHRWEPHVHTPGTLLNDQFTGEDPWTDFLDAVESSEPAIRAVGVTDYYLTGGYEQVLRARSEGRLPDVALVFPNVELRLDVGTVRGSWVNVHLLVSPETPDHLIQLHRLLARLQFRAHDDIFCCTPDDLMRLGRAADPRVADDKAALRHGAGQFKVSFDQLRQECERSGWARENVLIGIAGSQTDGTSGVRQAADTTLREEMEKFAHVIFASSPAQREFWLGLRSATEEQLKSRYGGLKPCLHGSDGHQVAKVGMPDGDRFSWVKGGLEFDALRQACIDPSGRAYVGSNPPEIGTPSRLLRRIQITGASWAGTPEIGFNPGLVAIVGARGSGKTALADILAMGCDAVHHDILGDAYRPSASFLTRAGELLSGAEVTVEWGGGDLSTRALDGTSTPEVTYPRARYLSQQFVEDLCSASGMTDELLREIERVIFESHPLGDRDGALNFSELLALRATRYREARRREEEALIHLSAQIGAELEKDKTVPDLIQQVEEKTKRIDAYTKDRSKLVSKGSELRVSRLTDVSAAADKVRGYVRFFNNQEQALLALRDEVKDVRTNQAPNMLRRAQERHAASRMTPDQWAPFLLDYTGKVEDQLAELIKTAHDSALSWKGEPVPEAEDPQTPHIADDAELSKLPLSLLEAEITRLQSLINTDKATQRQFAALSQKINEETAALQVLADKLSNARGAKERAKELQDDREASYGRVFESIMSEENVLTELYKPLMKRVTEASGTLRKLAFTVSRTANVQSWAETAEEELLDLRRQGPFRGKGTLAELAEASLREAWERGTPEEVSEAMVSFRETYQKSLLDHATVSSNHQAEFRGWLERFAQWLYSTNHIQLSYGIHYDGVDIRKLSPGTRGIVLLLLYLALDDADDRPLIIDQPEENLDPKSVFDELVGLFIAAKSKRQVIIVTHNANLVVNTDADQIIIADAGPHRRGELPRICYECGGMENARIRKQLCDILEGGQHAFKERARRLRVALTR